MCLGQSTAVADVQQFIRSIKFEGNIKTDIVYYDETLTTRQAKEILHRRKVPFGKEEVDMTSACLILNGFLEELPYYSRPPGNFPAGSPTT